VLATRVPRTSWVGATFLIASLGALLLSLLMGLGLAVGYGRVWASRTGSRASSVAS
jgi:hypothetical protein